MVAQKKNARSAAATAEQAKVGTDFAGLDPHLDCTQETTEKQAVFDLIPIGAANAMPRAQLCKITGLEDRALRLLVHRERRAGHQILTNTEGGGYYRPEDTRDTVHFISSMRRRAAETLAVADAVERSLLNECGQEQIEGWSPGER